MKRYHAFALSLGLTAFLTVGCVKVYAPPEGPSPATSAPQQAQNQQKEDEKKSPFKPYDEVLEDTRAVEGYFKFHIKRDNSLFLELRPDQLDQDFGMALHYSRGLGDFNVHDGLPLSDAELMRFHRVGDQVLLIHRNPRFVADPGSPMERSMQDNVGHSVLAAFEIKSEHEETKNLVLEVTDFFVSDYADISESLKFYYGKKPVNFDKSRSYLGKVMAFPKNVEIDAELTFKANDFPQFGGAGVSDFRSIPIGVRYSLFALPETPMQPRLADDRVGHFLTAVKDFSRDQEETSYVRYVNRWRLEKQDNSAEISEPVKPIVFYIDRTVPHEYRKYVKEGIEAWNRAFETAGFRNAIVAKEAPEDDSTWSAEDIRYSTVRWTAAHAMGYAIGPSEADPRTGELLNADILISSTFVRGWLYDWQELAGPEGMIQRYMEALDLQRRLPPRLANRMCLAQLGMAHQLGVQYAYLLGTGVLEPGEPMPEEYLGDALRDLIMHEVGHTLGLRHNFKGSSGIPHDRLQDEAFTLEHGLTLSVMDYGPVNVAVNPKNQGHYWNKEVGSYDEWVIRYAYTPIYQQTATNGDLAMAGTPVASPEAELSALQKIAEQAADPYHTYGTDEDNWMGAYAIDPLTNAWELGSDPVAYARDRAAIVRRVTPTLEGRLIAEGEGFQRLRGAISTMIFERFISLLPVTKTVGGIHFHRDHKGDPNGRLPFRPVSAERQREAVQLIIDQALAENAFRFDAEMLNKLPPNRYSHWGVGWFVAPLDYPVHNTVSQVQRILLIQLLSPPRLQRMIDNELRTPSGQAYSVSELFQSLTGAVWSELGNDGRRPRAVNSFRRSLQRTYTDQLITLMVAPPEGTPEDASSLARFHLKTIDARLENAVDASGLDDMTRAHLDETRARIERALEAGISIDAAKGLPGF